MDSTNSGPTTETRNGRRICPICDSRLVNEGLVSKRYQGRADICERCGYRESR